ncbi:MAG: 5-formyltetrahydrofolate cyclo-ligase [Desulforhopalus sp.]
MATPKELRNSILRKRDNLEKSEIEAKSRLIQDRLLQMPEVAEAKILFVYISFRSEVATLDLVDKLIEMGKTVTVPITRVAAKRLDAVKITDRAKDLEPGYCNIPEPTEILCTEKSIDPKLIETIILPGSVFDLRGGRFGYGGGFYDRFVSQVENAVRIGLAFDLQIVDKAPLQDHDELLDLVVTEKRVIRGSR